MIFHGYYDVPREEVDRFVHGQDLGRLVAVGEDGTPHLGLYPFVYGGGAVDLHLVRKDELITDLRARPRCVFEVDEALTVIPSYWVHPENAGTATAYHRTAIFECTATVSDEAADVIAQLAALLARYQPEGGFRPLAAEDPLYRNALAQLSAVHLTVERVRAKFKLAQNRTPEQRRDVAAHLRARGGPNDGRAADALEWTLGAATPRSAR